MTDGSLIFMVQVRNGGTIGHNFYAFNNPAWQFPQFTVAEGSSPYVHIAVVRNAAGQMSIFYDGVAASRTRKTANINDPVIWDAKSYVDNNDSYSSLRYLGHDPSFPLDPNVKSYVSNLRLVRGAALYDPTASTITKPSINSLSSTAPRRIASLGTITGGTGYTNGTYNNVAMTLASGSAASTYPTATIVVSGGKVTSVTITGSGNAQGTGVDLSTVLTAPSASIGGTGSGFSIPVATLSDTPILLNSKTSATVLKNSGDAGFSNATLYRFNGPLNACPTDVGQSFIGGVGMYNVYYAEGSTLATSGTLPRAVDIYDSTAIPLVPVITPSQGSLVKAGKYLVWNTKADGTGTDYEVNSPFTPTSNTTLYTKWLTGTPKLDQTVSPTSDSKTVIYGANSNTETVTGFTTNGDGTITYTTASSTCSVDTGGYVSITGARDCVIAVAARSSATYNAAAPRTFTLTVNKAPLTITASSPPTIPFGSPAPAITASYSGFVNGETTTNLITLPTCSAPTHTTSTPANTSVATSCTGAESDNYSFNYVSGSLAVAPLTPQVITASAESATVTYGANSNSYSITGFSTDGGGTLTYSKTSGNCAVNLSGIISITGAGDCVVSVGANSIGLYGAGTPVSFTLTVNRANLAITASSPSGINYGASTPAITASYDGFVNGENATNLTTSPSCSAPSHSSTTAASTVVTTSCSGAASNNYNISYNTGSFTVGQKALSITASSPTGITYGSAAPNITASYNGFANGETESALTTLPNCSALSYSTLTSATTLITTSCSGAASNNYNISYFTGGFTVGQKSLSITASSPTGITYGSAVPTITAAYNGFVNGETSSALTTLPDCIAVSYSPTTAAATLITTNCSGATSSNYDITYTNGSFTVAKTDLTITASIPSRLIVGSPVPTITPLPGADQLKNGELISVITNLSCTTTYSVGDLVNTPETSTCSGGINENYNITYVDGNYSVGLNDQVVSPASDSATVTYGDNANAFTITGFSSDGGGTITYTTFSSGCAVDSGGLITISQAGACSVSVGANGTPTYNPANPSTFTLNVDKARLTITASAPVMMTYGYPAPTITPSYSGFVNGETESALTQAPVCTSSYTPTTPSPTVIQTDCSGAATPNYEITYVSGSFIVNAAPSGNLNFPTPVLSPTGSVSLNIAPDAGGTIAAQIQTSSNESPGQVKVIVPPGVSYLSGATLIIPASGVTFILVDSTASGLKTSTATLVITVTAIDNATGVQVNKFSKPVAINFPNPSNVTTTTSSNVGVPAWSTDGLTWTLIPALTSAELPSNLNDGYFINSDGTITIYTRHLTIFGLRLKQSPLIISAPSQELEPTKSMQLTLSGGNGLGSVKYTSSTPTFCNVNSAGLLTAVKLGTCSVSASKLGSEVYLDAASNTLSISVANPQVVVPKTPTVETPEVTPEVPTKAADKPKSKQKDKPKKKVKAQAKPAKANPVKVAPAPAKVSGSPLVVQTVTYGAVRFTVRLGSSYKNKVVTVVLNQKGSQILTHDFKLNASGIGIYTTTELKPREVVRAKASLISNGNVIKEIRV
jgi:hypothetical protein